MSGKLVSIASLWALTMASTASYAQNVEKPTKSAANKHMKIDFSESIKPGYSPVADDERGLWMQVDEFERDMKASKFIIDDPALNGYVRGVLCKTVRQAQCDGVRLYIVRQPYFNASMAPNGMMIVWSGLLLRAQNEAQLATVLGHEYGHYEKRHSLQSFRSVRKKTDAMAWTSFIPFGGGLLAQLALAGSVFSFNRNMEREADKIGFNYIHKAGYDPKQAALVWKQLRDEQDATASERKTKSRKDKNGGFFATHPNSKERLEKLIAMAEGLPAGDAGTTGIERYRTALKTWWPKLIDDQIKLNDFGASLFLLNQISVSGWTPDLYFAYGELYRARGSDGDFSKATEYYQNSLSAGSDRPEVFRGLGFALMRDNKKEEGQGYLRKYIEISPNAKDAPIVKMMSGGI